MAAMFPPVQLVVARAESEDGGVVVAALDPALSNRADASAGYSGWDAQPAPGATAVPEERSAAATTETPPGATPGASSSAAEVAVRSDGSAGANGDEDIESGASLDSSADEELGSGSPIDSESEGEVDSGSLTGAGSDEEVGSGSLVDSGEGEDSTDAAGDATMPRSVAPSGGAGGGRRTARVSIPPLASNADPEQKKFHEAAARAVRRVYDQDFTDSAVLESLVGKLTSTATLLPLRADWQQPIDDAIARAKALQRISWSLRHLGKAFAEAEYDPEMTTYRDVDIVKCREAFKRIYDADETLLEMKVTIDEVGTHTLAQLEIICQDSHAVVLMDRDFPAIQGKKRLRKQVKKAYRKAFQGTKVRKVTLAGKWQKNPDDPTQRSLRATVGVERKDAFPEDPCVMQEVVLSQSKERRRWSKPECCEIESSLAIACDVIK